MKPKKPAVYSSVYQNLILKVMIECKTMDILTTFGETYGFGSINAYKHIRPPFCLNEERASVQFITRRLIADYEVLLDVMGSHSTTRKYARITADMNRSCQDSTILRVKRSLNYFCIHQKQVGKILVHLTNFVEQFKDILSLFNGGPHWLWVVA